MSVWLQWVRGLPDTGQCPSLMREDVWTSGVWHALGENMTFFLPCSFKSANKLLFVEFLHYKFDIVTCEHASSGAQFLMTSSREELAAICYRIH